MGKIRNGHSTRYGNSVKMYKYRLIFVNGARLDGGTGMGTQKLIDYLTALL